jgi:hypothetical protein
LVALGGVYVGRHIEGELSFFAFIAFAVGVVWTSQAVVEINPPGASLLWIGSAVYGPAEIGQSRHTQYEGIDCKFLNVTSWQPSAIAMLLTTGQVLLLLALLFFFLDLLGLLFFLHGLGRFLLGGFLGILAFTHRIHPIIGLLLIVPGSAVNGVPAAMCNAGQYA